MQVTEPFLFKKFLQQEFTSGHSALQDGQDIFLAKYTTEGTLAWVKTFGGNNDDVGKAVCLDNSGNVYTCGTFTGTVDFDPGNGTTELINEGLLSGFVQKLDTSGNFQWAIMNTRVGAAMQANSIAVDSDENVFLGGEFSGIMNFNHAGGGYNLTSLGAYDVCIQKLSPSGNFVWAKAFGGSTDSDICNSIARGAFNDIYLTGYFRGTVDFNPGAGIANKTSAGLNDIFVLKLDTTGNFKWIKTMGGTLADIGQDIDVDYYGRVVSCGSFQNTIDLDPNAGSNSVTSAGNSDAYIQQLDTTGNFLQAITFGAANADQAYGIALDGNNIYSTGRFNLTVDFDPLQTTYNLVAEGTTTGDIFVENTLTS